MISWSLKVIKVLLYIRPVATMHSLLDLNCTTKSSSPCMARQALRLTWSFIVKRCYWLNQFMWFIWWLHCPSLPMALCISSHNLVMMIKLYCSCHIQTKTWISEKLYWMLKHLLQQILWTDFMLFFRFCFREASKIKNRLNLGHCPNLTNIPPAPLKLRHILKDFSKISFSTLTTFRPPSLC